MERRRRRLEEEVTIPSKDKFESQKTDFECVNSARKIREREICSKNYKNHQDFHQFMFMCSYQLLFNVL